MKRIILLLLLMVSVSTQAQERLFSYTYQTAVLPKGKHAIEFWNTIRWQKSSFYREVDTRLEYEIGLGHRLATAFFINTAVFDEKAGPGTGKHPKSKISFSNEWKLQFSDQEHSGLGSALFEEIGYSHEGLKFETKLLFDKKFGKALHAINLIHELELIKHWKDEGLESGSENKIELDYGVSVQTGKHMNLGLEIREDNALAHHGKLEYSTLFAGPCISLFKSHYLLNLTVMPQLYSFVGRDEHSLNLKHHEKLETRVIFAF